MEAEFIHPKVLEEYDEAQVKKVFEQFGLAMYQVQCVEYQIKILLTTEYGPDIVELRQNFDQLLESMAKKTLGKLIATLLNSGRIYPTFESDLRKALKKRNWLVHDYFGERDAHLLTRNGREVMITELTALAYEFEILDRQLTSISDIWLKRLNTTLGLPDGFMEKAKQTQFEKILDEVKDL